MPELILIFLFVAYVVIYKIVLEYRVDHKSTKKIDTTKLTMDEIQGVPVNERKRRYANGYYDKK